MIKKILFHVVFVIFISSTACYAQVGINTENPTKTLDINGELRVRQLTPARNSEMIVADQDGNIYKTSDLLTFGDIKESYISSDHNGWFKLDGRQSSLLPSTAREKFTQLGLGNNLPNFTDYYTIGATGPTASIGIPQNTYTITRGNLPAFSLSGTTSADGAHTHTADDRSTGGSKMITGYPNTGNRDWQYWIDRTTSEQPDHTHTLSLANNGQGSPITPEPPYFALYTYIYLGL